MRQRNTGRNYRHPSASELLRQSAYSNNLIINEEITDPLPSFVRTGDTYFHQKELHANAMVAEYGLPTLFVTLSMAESRWEHLREILRVTDNGDTIPTNRPFHSLYSPFCA